MAVQVHATPSSVPTGARRSTAGWLHGTRVRVAITSLILGVICLAWIYPFVWMLSAALKSNAEVASGAGLIPASPQWGNFARAWTQARISWR